MSGVQKGEAKKRGPKPKTGGKAAMKKVKLESGEEAQDKYMDQEQDDMSYE
jgi:hypothetical protein